MESAAKLPGGPPCYPIGLLAELLIPIGLQYCSTCSSVKAYPRTKEKCAIFCVALEYIFLLESGRGRSGTILKSVLQWC